ncbi:MAG: acyl carrier protein phosphodiesterase [Desulforhopalus sp.]
MAHLYLSGDSDQVMLGNFITDFIKGKGGEPYRREVYLGILLHREIDSYTDQHQQVAVSKQRLWQRHRHYSSVIVDIFYDHFLAKNWQKFSIISLEDFACHSYTTIQRFDNLLPPKAKQVLPHMIANNWLVNYGKLEGVNRALQGMARRASFLSLMDRAIEDLQKDYEKFENDFEVFFPELAAHSKTYLRRLEDTELYQ